MSKIALEREGPLAVLRLKKARANAIDRTLLQDLVEASRELAADESVTGVLLASAHPRVFCPGLDLIALQNVDRAELESFMVLFAEAIQTLFGLEKPLVAALGGHAVAGGCVLALTADLRILSAENAQMGLNEVQVGVPLPWTVTQLLQFALPPPALARIALDGCNCADQEALQTGLAQELAPPDGFEEHCLERLASLASRESGAFGLTKRFLRESTLQRMREGEPERLPLFLDAWFSAGSQERIQAQIAKLTRPRGRS